MQISLLPITFATDDEDKILIADSLYSGMLCSL